LKEQFTELGAIHRCCFASDGQQAIDIIKAKVRERFAAPINANIPLRPVSLLLLDFQMPQKNGIQVLTEVKQFYN
jgi:CheY-like chemotaxis protein